MKGANDETKLIGSKTFSEWDNKWKPLPGGLMKDQRKLRPKVGLYRMRLKGQIVALGLGTDKTYGMSKRLYDLTRKGTSSRNHYTGMKIFEHREELEVELLLTGEDSKSIDWAKQLKKPMIAKYEPLWNRRPRSPKTFIRPKKRRPTKPGSVVKAAPYTGPIPKTRK